LVACLRRDGAARALEDATEVEGSASVSRKPPPVAQESGSCDGTAPNTTFTADGGGCVGLWQVVMRCQCSRSRSNIPVGLLCLEAVFMSHVIA
jgi:hypothetical protein